MIVSVDIIVVLNIFDNMLTFMGLVPQVFIFFYYIYSQGFGNKISEISQTNFH